MFKTQVLMVSAQAAPNLLPLLDEQFRPQEVVLLVTDKMKERASFLQSVIQPTGIKVRQEPFSATGDFDAMQQQLESLLKQYPDKNSIALNVTGGTKWMAITAQEVFRFDNRPVFYVDIESDHILFLGQNQKPQKINTKIRLENYLKAYGYQITEERSNTKGLTQNERELCQRLVANVGEWGGAIGQLNRLANEAEESKSLNVSLSVLENKDFHLDKLLRECQNSGLLVIAGKLIQFTNETSRFFANGGWLEEYINSLLNQLKGEAVLQDSSHLNLKIGTDNSLNEIDIAFMAKNRLHIIECKTKRLVGNHAGSAGTDSLYKLDSISDLGGLGTKAMLVSYRALGQADAKRAKDLKIKVVQGTEIQTLKTIVRSWIG